MPKRSSRSSQTSLQFFFPSVVAGILTWLFSQDLMLGIQVFIVVIIVSYIARRVYGR